jgi:hypothetical protein
MIIHLFIQAFQQFRSILTNGSLSSKKRKKLTFVAVINHNSVYTVNFLMVHLFSLHVTWNFRGTPYGEKSVISDFRRW